MFLISQRVPKPEASPSRNRSCAPGRQTETLALFSYHRAFQFFEIGFGSGEHLAYRADLLPDHGFIGAEPFLNGVASALRHIDEQGLKNVRLQDGDGEGGATLQ